MERIFFFAGPNRRSIFPLGKDVFPPARGRIFLVVVLIGACVMLCGSMTLVDRHGNRRVDYYGDKWQDNEVLRDIQWLRS
jgi:hypothetical protein